MSGLLPSSRLLPVTIAAIAVVIGTKMVALVGTLPLVGPFRSETAQAMLLAGGNAGVIGEARAEVPAPKPDAAVPEAPAAHTPAPVAAPVPVVAPPVAPVQVSAPAAAVPPRAMPAPTPRVEMPQAVAEIGGSMEALKLRRSQMEERERQLNLREATISATDKRLAERVAELMALQTRLQQLDTGLKDRDQANWNGMVKMYEGMRPRDAASIFNALDKPVLLEVLDRMKPAKAAPVLAAMETEKARQVTADLAAKRTRSTTATN